jgi:MoxR-like ATPase
VADLVTIQETVKRDIYVDQLIREYIVSIVGATRFHQEVYLGASPRGSLALFRMAQARAAIRGRDYVIPDDIKALALPALGHRVIVSPSARIKNIRVNSLISEIISSIPVPGTQVRR